MNRLCSSLTLHWLVQSGKVVYFRARQRGACTYFDDRRDGPKAHGLCWAPLCNDLQIVDVPGDHFSLLRQDKEDMSIIVDALQMVLSAFGWHTTIRRDQKIYNMNEVSWSEFSQPKLAEVSCCVGNVPETLLVVLSQTQGVTQWVYLQHVQMLSCQIMNARTDTKHVFIAKGACSCSRDFAQPFFAKLRWLLLRLMSKKWMSTSRRWGCRTRMHAGDFSKHHSPCQYALIPSTYSSLTEA